MTASCKFTETGLKVGDLIGLEFMVNDVLERYQVKLIGYIPGVSVMARVPKKHGVPVEFLEGDKVAVHFMVDGSVYGFSASVEQSQTKPIRYVHLSFPEQVDQVKVRTAERINLMLPVIIIPNDASHGDHVEGNLLDISATGVGVECTEDLGQIGEGLAFETEISFGGVVEHLHLSAVISNIQEATRDDKHYYHYGLEFHNLNQSEKLFVQGFVYEQLLHGRLGK